MQNMAYTGKEVAKIQTAERMKTCRKERRLEDLPREEGDPTRTQWAELC
jgi:hypothetical protein